MNNVLQCNENRETKHNLTNNLLEPVHDAIDENANSGATSNRHAFACNGDGGGNKCMTFDARQKKIKCNNW